MTANEGAGSPAPTTLQLLQRISALELKVHDRQAHVWMLEASLPIPEADPDETEHERWTGWQLRLRAFRAYAPPSP